MKNRLLLSTAVILASIGFASAQNAPGNSHDGAAHQNAAQQNEPHSSQSQQRNAQGAQKQTGPSGQHETTGQAPSSARDQANDKSVRDQNSVAQSGEHNRNSAGSENQAQQRNEQNQGAGRTNRDAKQRTGQQAPGERNGQRSQGRGAENQGGNRNAAQPPPQQRTGQNQGGQDRGNIELSSEQRTKIRETMLNGPSVPHVNNASFTFNIGAAVPSNVRIVEVPETLIELHPDWRGYSYFVVRDDIVIVDSGRHVVAMVPTGSSSARVEERGGARNAMNFDRAQIREVQVELQRQGFDVGEPDGMLGPRTREALMTFQKRRGVQATGEIDHDTFFALGRGQSETTGQAPRNGPPSGAGNNPQSNPRGGDASHATESRGNNRPSAEEPRTTGQSSGNPNGREGSPSSTQGDRRRDENSR
jgi:Putative peptidoglycan binding domain/Protein of unknown function (DUF1236)